MKTMSFYPFKINLKQESKPKAGYAVLTRWSDKQPWKVIKILKTKKEAEKFIKSRNEIKVYSVMDYKIKKVKK